VLRVGPRSKSRPCKASGRLGTQHNLPPIDIKSEAYLSNSVESPRVLRSGRKLFEISPRSSEQEVTFADPPYFQAAYRPRGTMPSR
jgi:hypothetical protein